ncbi:MAG: hypothetical protein ACOCVS_02655 [Planctomycetota bacterium]
MCQPLRSENGGEHLAIAMSIAGSWRLLDLKLPATAASPRIAWS